MSAASAVVRLDKFKVGAWVRFSDADPWLKRVAKGLRLDPDAAYEVEAIEEQPSDWDREGSGHTQILIIKAEGIPESSRRFSGVYFRPIEESPQ